MPGTARAAYSHATEPQVAPRHKEGILAILWDQRGFYATGSMLQWMRLQHA